MCRTSKRTSNNDINLIEGEDATRQQRESKDKKKLKKTQEKNFLIDTNEDFIGCALII